MNKKQHIIDVPDVPKIGVYAIRNKKKCWNVVTVIN